MKILVVAPSFSALRLYFEKFIRPGLKGDTSVKWRAATNKVPEAVFNNGDIYSFKSYDTPVEYFMGCKYDDVFMFGVPPADIWNEIKLSVSR